MKVVLIWLTSPWWLNLLKQRGIDVCVKKTVVNGALSSPQLLPSMEDDLFSIVILIFAI